MTKPLHDQTALVTGASRGIGAATAIALAEAGAHVVLTARTAKALEEVEQTIFDAGGSATIAPLDLAENEAIGRLAAAIGERWQHLDLMVLNAGTLGSLSGVAAIDPKELARTLTLNVSAPQAMIAAFDPMLRAAKAGKVIGLTSSVARNPRAYWGAYGASKAAFETLLCAYSEETAAVSRLRVAILDPGATRTAMRARAYPGEDPASVKPPEKVAACIVALATAGFEAGYRERCEG